MSSFGTYMHNNPSKKKQNINDKEKKTKDSKQLKCDEKKENKNENKNINKIDENDYNDLPYTQAIIFDKRNIFSIYLSLIKMKINIISIFCYPEEYSHKSITLTLYLLDFLFSFFMNAILYTDDVVSQKYHNNGELDFFTTLFLSLASNIASSIIMFFINSLISYREYLSLFFKEINYKNSHSYMVTFKKINRIMKIKVFFFYLSSLILSAFSMIYILIFCQIYKKSQKSLLINYVLGIVESFAYSVGIPIIICILRYISIKYKLKNIYRTSVYLDTKL